DDDSEQAAKNESYIHPNYKRFDERNGFNVVGHFLSYLEEHVDYLPLGLDEIQVIEGGGSEVSQFIHELRKNVILVPLRSIPQNTLSPEDYQKAVIACLAPALYEATSFLKYDHLTPKGQLMALLPIGYLWAILPEISHWLDNVLTQITPMGAMYLGAALGGI